jgi:hypothetical protein
MLLSELLNKKTGGLRISIAVIEDVRPTIANAVRRLRYILFMRFSPL